MLTIKDVRQYLQSFDSLKSEIQQITETINIYKNMEIDVIITQVITDMPRGCNISSNVEFIAIKRADYIGKLEQELHDKLTMISAINNALAQLNNLKKGVVYLRYINSKIGEKTPSMNVIAHELNLTISDVWRIENSFFKNVIREYYKAR